jgi:hypothetical protein
VYSPIIDMTTGEEPIVAQAARELRHKPAVRSVSNWLFITAGLSACWGGASFAMNRAGDVTGLVGALIGAGLFALLGLWCRFQPLAASVTALGLLVAAQVLLAVTEPMLLLKGVVLKIILLAVLVRGVLSARALRRE